jgi:alkyl hydroperoxide reductase subunit AhpC
VIQENPWVAKAFADKIGTNLPVLSDVKHEVARTYGIFDNENHRTKRFTFTLDKDGVIRAIHTDREALEVDAALDACRVLQRVDSTSGR